MAPIEGSGLPIRSADYACAMTKVVLIRHGRSTANAAGVLAGRAAVALDEFGRAQAEALREALSGVQVAAAYTSPIERCRETAALAGFPDAEVADGLSECDYGDWTGLKLDELMKEQVWTDIQARPTEVSFPGGETMTGMFDRVSAAIDELTGRHADDETIVAFSHGDPIKGILAHAFGMRRDDFQRIHVAPAGISAIDYRQPHPMVLCVNVGGALAAHLGVARGPVVGGGDVGRQ
ncbi:probable phosphomutase, MSMEG_4193 family [Tessaracoccus flavus]|nr:probable phosphomutase, MSMEG_4193 family [Tessaracoccus flavus]